MRYFTTILATLIVLSFFLGSSEANCKNKKRDLLDTRNEKCHCALAFSKFNGTNGPYRGLVFFAQDGKFCTFVTKTFFLFLTILFSFVQNAAILLLPDPSVKVLRKSQAT